MNEFNRICSPMRPMVENLDDTDAVRKKKIEFIKLRELSKSPYSIGSMNDIQKKISKLEEQIKGFETKLSFDDSDSDSSVDTTDKTSGFHNINKTEKKEIDKFAGVFSIVSTVAFNKPQRIKKIAKRCIKSSKPSSEKSEEKALPKFIELCQHPGFNSSKVTVLPGLVNANVILHRVQKAQPLAYTINYKKFFEKWFYYQSIEDILKDIFWYFFISKYGSDIDKKDLINYFSRAATNYVEFLYKISTESLYYQEKFKKVLPNLFSQALYAALSECFPDSWVQFNHEFIEDIIKLVFYWISGTRPTKGLWHHWNMQELKPTEQKLKEKLIEEQSRLGCSDDKMAKKNEELTLTKTLITPQSLSIGPLNVTNNVLFNLNGQSPLIHYYLQKNQVNLNIGACYLIKHKEILPRIDNNEATFAGVVSESLESLKTRGEIYKKFHERNSMEMKRFTRLQKISNANNEMRVQKLLVNKLKVHNLSNLMMHEFLKDKNSISFGSDVAIADAIMSMKWHFMLY